ncbi:MAG: ATP-binding cassette domain-containing protein [Alphaproteobacteria bacterium]
MFSKNIIFKAENISFSFQKKNILYDISFEVEREKLITIVGPNGSGKTTLAKIIISYLTPTTGKIWKAPNIEIGYVPQKFFFDSSFPLTVQNFLELRKGYKNNISHLLEIINIKHLLALQISQISGGELQKVMLVASLCNIPNLLILDEPIQGLDINSQIEFYKLLQQIRNKYNITIMMISHDLHMVIKTTDYVLCLNKHICCQGSPEFVNSDPAFIELFGKDTVNNFALYSHHHTHTH